MTQEVSTTQVHRRCDHCGPQWLGKASPYKADFKINQHKWDEDCWERRGWEEEEEKVEEEEEEEEEEENWRRGDEGEAVSGVWGNAEFMSLSDQRAVLMQI